MPTYDYPRPMLTADVVVLATGYRPDLSFLSAQVRRRIEYDLEYMENWSLLLDFKIILKTIYVIFRAH